MSVHRWEGAKEIWPDVAALQQNSTHPIARAMVQFIRSKCERENWPEAVAVTQSQHGGIGGTVEGRPLWIGNQSFIERQGIIVADQWTECMSQGLAEGYSPILIAQAGQIAAVALVGDGLRPDVAQHVAWLKQQGWEVGILSGDHQTVVRQVANAIQVPSETAFGDLLPEDKVRMIAQSQQNSAVVVMVGDGVNDSAALAAASVGIAAHHSAEVSLQAAPVYLGRPGLSGVIDLLQVSQGTMRNIRRNFAFSLTYNLTAVCLAGLGFINPLGAAILMPISSLTVVGLSFWPIRHGDQSGL
jgi:Cu2+-exporting ATPase